MINKEKEMSKRQVRKEQLRRKEQRSRLIGIGLITIGALFVAFLIIYPNFKPVGAIADAPANTRANVDFNTVGDPNAPIKIEEYSDFQCPFCRVFFELCCRWHCVFCLSFLWRVYRCGIRSGC